MSETTAKKKSAGKIALIVLASVVGVVLLLLLAVRLYFRLPVSSYYRNSEKTFVIPGLSDGMIVQGLAYDKEGDQFFVTGYHADGTASEVRIVSKASGKETKSIRLGNLDGTDYAGHVGGITVNGKYIYVTDDTGLMVYGYDDFKNAENGTSVQAQGKFSTKTEDDLLAVAFVHTDGNMLYLGEFYREANYPTPDSHKITTAAGDNNTALILAYHLDDTAPYGIRPGVAAAYSIPGLVQGMCFDDQARFCLSTSYGPAFSHLYVYDDIKQEGTVTVLGDTIPLYVLDSSSRVLDLKIAPMSEEIVFVDERLYTMCESASNKYIFGKFTSAKYCYATDLSAFEK